MNERLQFSWGHIIAFMALIAFSYVAFVGLIYLSNGNFNTAAIWTGIIDAILMLVFIGAQQLKASGKNMARKINIERTLIFGSPIIFIIAMIPVSHAWTLNGQQTYIVSSFTQSINHAKDLFSEYDAYSDKRITNLNNTLNNSSNLAKYQKQNILETLELQLRSHNYDSLKNSAIAWIDKATEKASTWNVFMLGNTQMIKQALNNWESDLNTASTKILSYERKKTTPFTSEAVSLAVAGINKMTDTFTTIDKPDIKAIIFGIVTYLMLLLPYILQSRHSKSIYLLFGKIQSEDSYIDIDSSVDHTTATKPTSERDTADDDMPESF